MIGSPTWSIIDLFRILRILFWAIIINSNIELLISILSKRFRCSNESNQKAIRDRSSKVETRVTNNFDAWGGSGRERTNFRHPTWSYNLGAWPQTWTCEDPRRFATWPLPRWVAEDMHYALLILVRRGVNPWPGEELLASRSKVLISPDESTLEKILNRKICSLCRLQYVFNVSNRLARIGSV